MGIKYLFWTTSLKTTSVLGNTYLYYVSANVLEYSLKRNNKNRIHTNVHARAHTHTQTNTSFMNFAISIEFPIFWQMSFV